MCVLFSGSKLMSVGFESTGWASDDTDTKILGELATQDAPGHRSKQLNDLAFVMSIFG